LFIGQLLKVQINVQEYYYIIQRFLPKKKGMIISIVSIIGNTAVNIVMPVFGGVSKKRFSTAKAHIKKRYRPPDISIQDMLACV
jgi:hypothetical protein